MKMISAQILFMFLFTAAGLAWNIPGHMLSALEGLSSTALVRTKLDPTQGLSISSFGGTYSHEIFRKAVAIYRPSRAGTPDESSSRCCLPVRCRRQAGEYDH